MNEEEPKIDENALTPEQKEEMNRPLFPKAAFITIGIIFALMVVCVIVIVAVQPK